jgi:hypothetical protein
MADRNAMPTVAIAFQGRCPASEVNEGGCSVNTDHIFQQGDAVPENQLAINLR